MEEGLKRAMTVKQPAPDLQPTQRATRILSITEGELEDLARNGAWSLANRIRREHGLPPLLTPWRKFRRWLGGGTRRTPERRDG